MSLDNLRVLLLDDEQISLEHSKAAIASFIPEQNIFGAASAVEAMRILEFHPVEMAFLDIEMPDTDGFSMAEYIRDTYPQVKLVFLTGHVELGAKSFDYEPFDFLGKPIDVMRLHRTLKRYEESVRSVSSRQEMMAVDTGTGLVLISPDDILYIAKERRKSVIHCVGQDYPVSHSLEELETIFADYRLFRTHQSFLVPLSKIASVQPADFGKTYMVYLVDGTKVPMSRIQYSKLRGHLTASGIRIL